MQAPDASEYPEFYLGYGGLVPPGDLVETLGRQIDRTLALLQRVPAAGETHRYAEGKWSVREVVGHVIDAERLFTYRALHIARGDPAPLPGMDQEEWASASNAHERPLAELADELEAVRRATLHLFGGLPPEVHDRRGIASGYEISVRCIGGIVAGHELHHRRILKERYLPEIDGWEDDGP
ncbi:MAG: DinB family protein [Gemmatimonadetes bacterium]|nr:DinB family protein [Gemmatimonadota bacterium]NIR78287.1 DinB family protein [Gemmatimonadota bacterium]NIT86871.1 DinB family protein [Gemmatimonadota bacterium]NIU30740.1 DinB family protein [Gemmatimonadota bacterium]NIV61099.1 DinB family protein [Gemmatimonadota bacterium]